jgi:hypothetical protein
MARAVNVLAYVETGWGNSRVVSMSQGIEGLRDTCMLPCAPRDARRSQSYLHYLTIYEDRYGMVDTGVWPTGKSGSDRLHGLQSWFQLSPTNFITLAALKCRLVAGLLDLAGSYHDRRQIWGFPGGISLLSVWPTCCGQCRVSPGSTVRQFVLGVDQLAAPLEGPGWEI